MELLQRLKRRQHRSAVACCIATESIPTPFLPKGAIAEHEGRYHTLKQGKGLFCNSTRDRQPALGGRS